MRCSASADCILAEAVKILAYIPTVVCPNPSEYNRKHLNTHTVGLKKKRELCFFYVSIDLFCPRITIFEMTRNTETNII